MHSATIMALALPAVSIAAQAPRPSQRASVSQRIGPAEIVITYHRPVARGRPKYGALVPWDLPGEGCS